MLVFKYNIWTDLRSIIKTIFIKGRLDKERHIYYLSVGEKYRRVDYRKLTDQIKEEMNKYPLFLRGNFSYIVYLSKYGVLGSYALPNKVFVNIQRDVRDIVLTIIHEIVHLQIEEEVRRKKLSQEQKERLVEDKVKEILSR